MKPFIRNYVLNLLFFPLLTGSAIFAFYIYNPAQTWDVIRIPATIQLVASFFLALVCTILMLSIGHIGTTLHRLELMRNQQLLSSLDKPTKDKIANIYLDDREPTKELEFRPRAYYFAAFGHLLLTLAMPGFLLYSFRGHADPNKWTDTLRVLLILNPIAFWVVFNFFRNYFETATRTLKRLSDRCLYYSSESLRRSQIFNTISEVVKIFNEEQDLLPVMKRILDDSIHLLDLDAGAIEIFLEGASVRKVVSPNPESVAIDEDFCELVVGRSEVHNNLILSRMFAPLAAQGYFSMLHVALEVHGKDVGYMAGFSKKKRDLRDADLDFFYTFGRQASMVVENAYLLEKVKILSVTDGLTGLNNHRYFKEAITTEVRRAVRYKKSLCVVMIDIDHFKHYNDTNGHPAGDRVLQKMAKILRELARDTDMVARYGGEEFVLVLTETTKEGGAEFARRLCKVVEKERFDNEEKQPGGQLTISVGVAACSQDATEATTLIDLADKALYAAKNSGRNRVCVHGEK